MLSTQNKDIQQIKIGLKMPHNIKNNNKDFNTLMQKIHQILIWWHHDNRKSIINEDMCTL